MVNNPTGKGGFKKGKSGNPKGRAKKAHEVKFLDLLRNEITENDWHIIIRTAISFAQAGDTNARRWLSDYTMGPPVQKQEITGEDGGAVKIKVTIQRDE